MIKKFYFSISVVAVLMGCGTGGSNAGSQTSLAQSAICESALTHGGDCTLVENETILATLGNASGLDSLGDAGTAGTTSYPLTLTKSTNLDLCFTGSSGAATLSIYQNGKLLASMPEQSANYNCNNDAYAPITLSAGNYTVTLSSALNATILQEFKIYLKPTVNTALNTGVSSVNEQLVVAPADAYNPSSSYPANSIVSYEGNVYESASWADSGVCPIKANCPIAYKVGTPDEITWTIWKKYDPAVKHEFAYYDYSALQAKYPTLPACSQSQYSLDNVKSVINASVASGEISKSTPEGGFTQADKDAMYREYMLPCQPDLSSYTPLNVQTVQKIMPKSVWDKYASNTASGDLSRTYMDANRVSKPWPTEASFKDNAYNSFLNAVARYPYFCGEKGYFDTVDEACKREIASFLGHAAQETGETQVTQDFKWLRESYVDGGANSYFSSGCSAPFVCNNVFERYYGRGPKQLTSYFNYAGFSAAYFNGNYQFLLSWPDLVAYDSKQYFASAIFFTMAHQAPKPSIHDVMLGIYKPSADCVKGSESGCYGMQYDAISGVKNNFGITTVIVNGGSECRLLENGSIMNPQQSQNRTLAYKQVLTALGAKMTSAEQNMPSGCDFVANNTPFGSPAIFGSSKLNTTTSTWIDLSGSSCKAQSTGGGAMVGLTAPGIVNACLSSKK